jgi:GTP-binding protein
MANLVAIVGRPNVGKSTLFNRLVEKRQAIMDDMPGVTRDRQYGQAEWTGKHFIVIDTGGYVSGSSDKYESEIRKQVKVAIDESTAVLFVVDCREGLTPLDEQFARVIRASGKKVFLVANKADSPDKGVLAAEFYGLGMGDPYPVSAANGAGTGELLDDLVRLFPTAGIEDPDAGIPKIAIVGRPNAGKSSLLNVLLGTERSIVTEEAGTTRDAIHTRYKMYGKDFILIDTAGIRRKAKVKADVEFYSVLRALRTLEECDVAIVVVDARRGLESQDVNLINLADRNGKGIVLMMNKWDLVEKDSKTADALAKDIRERLSPVDYLPIVFASALTKQRIFQVMEKAIGVHERKSTRITTSELNDALLPEIARYPPPAIKGKLISIKYITQLPSRTPSFVFFCNLPQYIQESYQRFLRNRLREKFDFEGVPIRLFFRKK